MANAASSVLEDAILKFDSTMTSAEWKAPDSAAIIAARKSEMGNPLLSQLRTSESRTVNAKFPIRQTATGGVVRVAEHSGSNPDTSTEALSWSKFVEDFSINKSLAENNAYEFIDLFVAGQRNNILNLINRVDASFVASVLADETTANAGGANGTFNATTDEYEIDNINKDDFFYEVKSMMENNLYGGEIVGIVNSKANVLRRKLAADGSGNASNTAASLAGFSSIVPTTRTITASSNDASGLFFQNGLVAVNFWVPPANRQAMDTEKAMADNVGAFGEFSLPDFPNIKFAQSIYVKRADLSGSGGNEQDIQIHVENSLEMAYASAPVSAYHTETSPVFNAIVLPS